MKKNIVILLATLCCGCASNKPPISMHATTPPGTEKLLANAYRLIDAYQQDDAKTWNNLVCMALSHENVIGLAAVKSWGKIQSPRLVSVSAVSDAANALPGHERPMVAIEVQAENYPSREYEIRFYGSSDRECVLVTF